MLNEEKLHGNEESEANIIDMLIVLARNKSIIIAMPITFAIVSFGIAMVLPSIYTATAKILPPQQSQSNSSALLGQLGSLGGLAGASLGLKNPSDLYVGMLTSRTVSDNLIHRFDLKKVYETKTDSDTRKILTGVSNILAGKEGIIAIDVDDEDPKRAADLANAYVAELQKLTQTMAITEASQRRLFFENQLKIAKEGLTEAEVNLKNVQEKTGLLQLTGQAEAIIKAAAELKARISSKEVELGAMRSFATASNPEVVRTQNELTGLNEQLKKMERGLNQGEGDVLVPTGKMPAAGLEYVRSVRDVKYYETIYELMAKQFEIAKIDEAKQSSIVQVLDPAVTPDKKSKPRRLPIILAATFAGFLLSLGVAFAREGIRTMKRDPKQHLRLQLLRNSLRGEKEARL